MEHSGKIFLSEQRGCIEGPLFKRNCSFNFDTFFSAHKMPLESLYVFNEEILGGTAELELEVKKPSYVILMPVTGDLEYTDIENGKISIGVGEVFICRASAAHHFRIGNPYEQETINLIQIWIEVAEVPGPSNMLLHFDPGSSVNQLVEISSAATGPLPFRLSIGQFDGREETIYKKAQNSSRLFCYVLAGAFEVEGRLLHAQDGLGLWDVEQVELEALSNDALILTIEY